MTRNQLLMALLLIAPASSHAQTPAIKPNYGDHNTVIARLKGFAMNGEYLGCTPDDTKIERVDLILTHVEPAPLVPNEIKSLADLEAWAASVPDPKVFPGKYFALQFLQGKLKRYQQGATLSVMLVLTAPDKTRMPNAIRIPAFELALEVPVINAATGRPIPHQYAIKSFTQDTIASMPKPWLTKCFVKSFRASFANQSFVFPTGDQGTMTLIFKRYAAFGTIWRDFGGKKSVVADVESVGDVSSALSMQVKPPEWLALMDNVALGTWKGFASLIPTSNFKYLPPVNLPTILPLPGLNRCE